MAERRLLAAVARERQRIAQLLHDTAAQSLNGYTLLARLAMRRAVSRLPELKEEMDELDRTLRHGLTELQEVMRSLEPGEAEPREVSAALAALAEQTSSRLGCSFSCPGRGPELDGYAAGQLLQIAREAVENALRHSQATAVQISLAEEETGQWVLSVSDDGQGFVPKINPEGRMSGLELIQYRASAMGAAVTVDSTPGRGTRIHCQLPANHYDDSH